MCKEADIEYLIHLIKIDYENCRDMKHWIYNILQFRQALQRQGILHENRNGHQQPRQSLSYYSTLPTIVETYE
jgi:hypothetical protein